jgi:hypothetical protein
MLVSFRSRLRPTAAQLTAPAISASRRPAEDERAVGVGEQPEHFQLPARPLAAASGAE